MSVLKNGLPKLDSWKGFPTSVRNFQVNVWNAHQCYKFPVFFTCSGNVAPCPEKNFFFGSGSWASSYRRPWTPAQPPPVEPTPPLTLLPPPGLSVARPWGCHADPAVWRRRHGAPRQPQEDVVPGCRHGLPGPLVLSTAARSLRAPAPNFPSGIHYVREPVRVVGMARHVRVLCGAGWMDGGLECAFEDILLRDRASPGFAGPPCP